MSAACSAWNDREGTDSIRDYIKILLSPEGLQASSTEELHGLSKEQQAESKKPNKGLYANRDGGRALSTQEHKKREADARRLKQMGGQISEVDNERKRGSCASSRLRSTALASPPAVAAVQFSGRRRGHTDAAD